LERTAYEFASFVMYTTYWSGIATNPTLRELAMDVLGGLIINSEKFD